MPCSEVHNAAAANAGRWRKKNPNPYPNSRTKPPAAAAADAAPGGGRGPGLQIRQVWADNVEREFQLIRAAVEHFPYVSMDTEFPGVIHHPTKHPAALTPTERYALVKANVDALHLIQVGLTFAATPSSPPALAFEINLSDFDPRVHRHAPDSLRLLAANGMDFAANRARGVPAAAFAALMMSSGLVCNHGGAVTWVTFHSAYDFAYLIKLLMGRKLPRSMPDFLRYVRVFFGHRVYDVKHMMTHCVDLYGGLDSVAATLKVPRVAGRSHQAGSDSVLTWDTFRRINHLYFSSGNKQQQGVDLLHSFAGVLFGLEIAPLLDTNNNNMKKEQHHAVIAAPPPPRITTLIV